MWWRCRSLSSCWWAKSTFGRRLVVHPVQEDDPEKDEENNEVDNEEDREVGAGFVGVHHGDGVQGSLKNPEGLIVWRSSSAPLSSRLGTLLSITMYTTQATSNIPKYRYLIMMEYLVNSTLTVSIYATISLTLVMLVVLLWMMKTCDSSRKFLITRMGCSVPDDSAAIITVDLLWFPKFKSKRSSFDLFHLYTRVD